MIENTCSPSPKLRLLVQTKQGTLQSEKWSTDMAENRGGGCTPEEQCQTTPGDPVRLGHREASVTSAASPNWS